MKCTHVLQRALAMYADAWQNVLTGMLEYRPACVVHVKCLAADALLLGVMMMGVGWMD